MFAALSNPNENIVSKYIDKFIAIAPVVFMKQTESEAIKFLFEKNLTK